MRLAARSSRLCNQVGVDGLPFFDTAMVVGRMKPTDTGETHHAKYQRIPVTDVRPCVTDCRRSGTAYFTDVAARVRERLSLSLRAGRSLANASPDSNSASQSGDTADRSSKALSVADVAHLRCTATPANVSSPQGLLPELVPVYGHGWGAWQPGSWVEITTTSIMRTGAGSAKNTYRNKQCVCGAVVLWGLCSCFRGCD